MGLLINGHWHDQWYDTKSHNGRFERDQSRFRDRIGEGPFRAEAGRYHLYVSLACPWAHRTLIAHRLKRLDNIVSISSVHPLMLEHGWEYRQDPVFQNPHYTLGDPLYNSRFHHQLYTRARPDYSGRVTVPVLWDRKEETIVNNESADILRIFNSAFSALAPAGPDLYPKALRREIDAVNERVYAGINNGVYRCGFATSQEAYEEAFGELFEALDEVEARLARQAYLAGNDLTEADWRLFTTLVRFDPVYFGHFKTNQRRIADYPNLSNYLRHLYQQPGIAQTTDFRHIKHHYYGSHATINPTRIVPAGPLMELDKPHDRDRFGPGN
ncbi:glutathione-dependent reductase [Marinobacterium nitratireducens]|uniref:Glutathione-dependent reductase n=1 Tax=Marinobacterium nitratireducens TaxID=518897 RepID=A0A917Z648_9GAMM|nr:glutathione S-transferase family protein [Marinobacterium nitratireducens]GGO75826.1 glutathione-dependent reductase [Marinobacterium nitratireducens]